MGSTSKKAANAKSTKYQPSANEIEALKKYLEHKKEKSSARLKVVSDASGTTTIKPDHPEQFFGQMQLMQALGTVDYDFASGIVLQLANAAKQAGEIDENVLNFMLSVIKGVAPKDHIESMLACQMVAVHLASMRFARNLAHVENLPQQDSAERALNKLTRTFVTQMEALKRYRTGGEQKVTVQHVSVGEGGQAIVGNVTQAPRENAPDNKAASAPALTHAQTAPMPTVEASRKATLAPVRRKRDP